MKVCGKMINKMAKVGLSIEMEMYMRVISLMIKLKVMEFTSTQMALNQMDSGSKISFMGKPLKFGQMVQNMKGSTKMVKKMAKVNFPGKNGNLLSKDLFHKIISKDMEFTNGLTVDHMKEIDQRIKWMEKGNLSGQMVEYILVNIKIIRNMDMVSFNFLKARNMKVSGKMVSSMDKANIQMGKVRNQKGNGSKEKG